MNIKLKIKDERIEKKYNEICAHLYILIVSLTIVVAGFKYILVTQNSTDYILELIAILGSLGYLFIRTAITKIPLFKHSDECIYEIQNRYRTHSFNICFITYISGGFILTVLFDKSIVAATYIAIWSIPALICTFKVIKQGLFIWGSKKTEKVGVKSFKIRVVIGSVFFGIINGWNDIFKDNVFKPSGLFWVAGMAIGWGVPFYFIMKLFMNKSEKYANNELIGIEQENKTDI